MTTPFPRYSLSLSLSLSEVEVGGYQERGILKSISRLRHVARSYLPLTLLFPLLNDRPLGHRNIQQSRL